MTAPAINPLLLHASRRHLLQIGCSSAFGLGMHRLPGFTGALLWRPSLTVLRGRPRKVAHYGLLHGCDQSPRHLRYEARCRGGNSR
ncbi:MAG UNVERIFIED_CONTAM: hypothetical protein LVR18_38210 [Planctomycetaceae bacterium]